MVLFITRRPEKHLVGVVYSRWTALHNPYNFEFTRKDFPVVSTAIRPAYHATLPTIRVTGDLTNFLEAGETIYLNSGVYDGAYEVEAVYPISATLSYVVINTPYTSVGGSGYINVPILVNYKLYVNIYNNLTGVVIDTLYPKPDTTGFAMVNMSGVIISDLVTQDNTAFTLINQKNNYLSGGFYIGYGYSYKFGETQITTTEVTDNYNYYWSSSAMQVDGRTLLGMSGAGQNLKSYVPYNVSGSVAKFLTMFEKPTKFEGYPFTIGFIYSELFPTNYLERHQINYNINRVATSSESDNTLLSSEVGFVNSLQVADEDATTTQLDIWLETGGTIEDGIFDEDVFQLGLSSQYSAPSQGG